MMRRWDIIPKLSNEANVQNGLALKSYSSCNTSFKFHWDGPTAHKVLSSFPGKLGPIVSHMVRESLCYPSSLPAYIYSSTSIWVLCWAAALKRSHRTGMIITYSTLFSAPRAKFFFSPQHYWKEGFQGLKYSLHILLLIFKLRILIDNLLGSFSGKNQNTT